MSAERLFAAANALALLGWLAVAAGLAFPAVRRTTGILARLVVPLLLALAYVALVAHGLAAGGGGKVDFGSIAGVRAIFAKDLGVVAGWIHYLAFDLLVGTWIARAGITDRVPRLALAPCLLLTFLAGPAGWLLFVLVRLGLRRPLAELA